MQAQVPTLVRWFQYYAAVLRTEERAVLPTTGQLHNFVTRRPLGVVALITPFNHPLLIAVKKLAPALAAGNSVVLKPSELTPLTSLLLGPLLRKAGVPDGVFSVLPGYGGSTGRALASHPLVRKVDVTGSTAAGRSIGEAVGRNLGRFTAELGGKAPVIVFGDADLQAAANGVAFGAFVAAGQTCVAATRVIVDGEVYSKFLEMLQSKVRSITSRIGSPQDERCMMGPLISAQQLDKVEALVEEALETGYADRVAGRGRMVGKSELDGSDLSKGHYYSPTIITSAVSEDSIRKTKIWREELFAPVVVVIKFANERHAIELANDSQFGLGAAIWTRDMATAFRVSESIEAGIVWVNTHHRNDPSSPWGGATSASGVGSENGMDAYYEYTTTKSTIINYASAEESLASEDWFREGDGQVRYG